MIEAMTRWLPTQMQTSSPTYKLWFKYCDLPDYQHILELMGERKLENVDSDMLREMDKYDLEVMRNYVKWHNPIFKPRFSSITNKERRLVGVRENPFIRTVWGPVYVGQYRLAAKTQKQWDREFILSRKKWYLKACIEVVEEYFEVYKHIWEDLTLKRYDTPTKLVLHAIKINKHYAYLEEFSKKAYFTMIPREYDELQRMYKRAKGEYNFFGIETKNSKLTPEMIQLAKDHPFGNLIDFGRRGMVKCPYHNEKTPSFSWNKKENYAHCFGCGRTVDTIQYIMDTMNLEFREAVLKLSGQIA